MQNKIEVFVPQWRRKYPWNWLFLSHHCSPVTDECQVDDGASFREFTQTPRMCVHHSRSARQLVRLVQVADLHKVAVCMICLIIDRATDFNRFQLLDIPRVQGKTISQKSDVDVEKQNNARFANAIWWTQVTSTFAAFLHRYTRSWNLNGCSELNNVR